MKTSVRRYDHACDYERVNRFLIKTYRTSPRHINWLQPRWEYMHGCSGVANVDLSAIGIWESQGEIVAMAHPECFEGYVYFEFDPDFAFLKREMLAYGQDYLHGATEDGRKRLSVEINDEDEEFLAVASEMGFAKSKRTQTMLQYPIPDPFPDISLPDGFVLKSLADGYDIEKLALAIWRGFNHKDDPPANNLEWRRRREAGPNFRPDLTMRVETEDGDIAAYCGIWHEKVNRIAYVEPVCTVPEYRRMGLGFAAVRESIRRCGAEGASVAYVGSDQAFYHALGFKPFYTNSVWTREWA